MLKTISTNHFPAKPFLANGIALWIMCAILHEIHLIVWATFQPKDSWGDFLFIATLYLIFATIHASFYFVLSLLPQMILYHFFKVRIRKRLWWWIIFLSPFALLGSFHLYLATPTVQARTILSNANLASLPESAQDISVYTWSSLMSGEEFLKFDAESEEIAQFISSSPILKDVVCNTYTKDRMRLLQSENFAFRFEDVNDPHEYFRPDSSNPDWYKEEIKGAGRRYEFQPDGYHYPGEVIIDDDQDIVYVKLTFS